MGLNCNGAELRYGRPVRAEAAVAAHPGVVSSGRFASCLLAEYSAEMIARQLA